jgi:hypothetical protein
MSKPSVGRIVHYVSYGTPHGEFTSACRAAIVAGVPQIYPDADTVDLVVLNPTGLFFNRCDNDEEEHNGGTWHWPERVDP